MKCEMDYCIFNRSFLCTLKSVQMDSLGMSGECVIVSIPGDILNALKKEQIMEMQNQRGHE